MLCLARERAACQRVVVGHDRLMGHRLPVLQGTAVFGSLPGQEFLAGDDFDRPIQRQSDRLLHFASRLLEHGLRILEPLHHFMKVGRNDIADTLE
jgi:hypothetical protein